VTDTDTLHEARLCTVCLAQKPPRETELEPTTPAVCPSCVYQVRWLLNEIQVQVVEAHVQYLRTPVTHGAMMVVGPAANYEASSYLHQSATSGRLCRCTTLRALPTCIADLEPDMVCPDAAFVLDEHRDDTLHPSTILQAWALTWRRINGHEQPDTITIATEARYLLQHLTRLAQHEDVDLAEMTANLQSCHGWMDGVLQRGKVVVKGEPCPTCRGPRLVLDGDLWICKAPACGQTYTEYEYDTKVHGLVLQHATHLHAAALAERLDLPHSTIRNWASRQRRMRKGEPYYIEPLIYPVDTDHRGRNLYAVADVEAVAESMTQRARA